MGLELGDEGGVGRWLTYKVSVRGGLVLYSLGRGGEGSG